MEFADFLSDSGQFAGFNLSDIEGQRGDYESQDIIDISVSSAHTLDLSDIDQCDSENNAEERMAGRLLMHICGSTTLKI